MNLPDIVNGLFELLGALMIWMNVFRLHKDKQIKGTYWPLTIFWTAWGFWNLYYYPLLDQWWSFAGGCSMVVGNIVWLCQAIYYTTRPNPVPPSVGHYR
jgi:hypothetical protein